jgi:hypothetical protein
MTSAWGCSRPANGVADERPPPETKWSPDLPLLPPERPEQAPARQLGRQSLIRQLPLFDRFDWEQNHQHVERQIIPRDVQQQ